MKEFIKSILSDVDGQNSSKRVITIGAFGLMGIAFLVDMFVELKMQSFVWDSMFYIVAGGLGLTTIEKFSRTKK